METQNVEDKENIRYIESVSDFLNDVKGIKNKSGYTLFYRGHSDKNYELKPSIYRNENFIKNEDKIYRETIAKVPYDFNGKNTIETLWCSYTDIRPNNQPISSTLFCVCWK